MNGVGHLGRIILAMCFSFAVVAAWGAEQAPAPAPSSPAAAKSATAAKSAANPKSPAAAPKQATAKPAAGAKQSAVKVTVPITPQAAVKTPAPVTGPLHLTPDSAAQMAIERSTDLGLADQNVLAARGNLKQAQALNGWQLNLQGTYTRTGPTTTLEFGGQSFSLVPGAILNETLSASKPLYLGGRDRYARQAAVAGIASAQQGKAADIVGVALQARAAVFTLLRLEQLVVVAQQELTAATEHLRITNAMYKQGTVARFEVVQAETSVADDKGSLISAQTNVAQQKATIAQLLNVRQGTGIEAAEGVPAQLPPGDLHALIKDALQQRPEMKQLQAAVRADESNLRLAQANDNVSLTLNGSLEHGTATPTSGPTTWTVVLALNKPILQGGETRAKIIQAQAALNAAKLNVEKGEEQIALQISQALLNVQDAQSALVVAQQGEVEARDRLQIANVRFSNGVGLGLEVLDAQTALASARTQVINARYNLQVAIASLRAALGVSDVTKESAR